VIGQGATQIAVTIETGLLRQVDEYAKSHGVKRTQLIALGLRAIIGKPRKSA
jgi:metal-responsive CopG/Arc/MetJ family transcriptional regulator